MSSAHDTDNELPDALMVPGRDGEQRPSDEGINPRAAEQEAEAWERIDRESLVRGLAENREHLKESSNPLDDPRR